MVKWGLKEQGKTWLAARVWGTVGKDEAWLAAGGSARVRKSLEVRDGKNSSSFCSQYWDIARGWLQGALTGH